VTVQISSPGPREQRGTAESTTDLAEPSVPTPRVDNEQLVPARALLAERFRAGDLDALSGLYMETSPLVFTIALRTLGDQSDAEDATQRVYLEAWRRRAAYEPSMRPLGAWLVGIARHVVAARIAERSRQAGLDNGERDVGRDDLASDDATDGIADRVVDAIVVADGLSRLDQPRRDVVEMSFFQGLTHTQIAEALGIPVGSVKSHIKRGLAELRRQLGVSDGAS
jgi:RNA polymerase sigma-70 factor (ECF subfamily)